jgi:hypothetical protein
MVSFSVKARVKPDGSLQVAIPTGLPESDVDVLVVVRPVCAAREAGPAIGSWPEGASPSSSTKRERSYFDLPSGYECLHSLP